MSAGSRVAVVSALVPLDSAGVRGIEQWFDHAEVQRWLGPRSWIRRELRLIGERPGTTFRGMPVLRSYGWLAIDHHADPVAFIGGDVHARWVRYHGEGLHGPVVSDEDPRRSMGLGYVVDPARWGQGYGRGAIRAVLGHPDVDDVEVFFCGIDVGNLASRRCALGAGFHLADPHPDHEGTLYYRRERPVRARQ